jgi:drug/metabolite transporter, DME family
VQPHLLGIVIGIGSAFTWAIGGTLTKVLVEGKDPIFINAVQSVFASGLMIATVVGISSGEQIIKIGFVTFLILFIAAILGFVLGDSFFFTSLKHIPVSIAFPLASSYPVFTVVFAWLLISETITWVVVLAAMLVVGGIGFIGRSQYPERSESSILSTIKRKKGILIALFSAMTWGIGTVVMKVGTFLTEPIIVSAIMAWISTISLVSWQIVRRNLRGELKQFTPRSWVMLGVAGIVGGMGLTNILFMLSVHYIGASKAAILTATSPLFSALLAWIFLNERLSWFSGFGILLIISGTILVSM